MAGAGFKPRMPALEQGLLPVYHGSCGYAEVGGHVTTPALVLLLHPVLRQLIPRQPSYF